MDAGGAVAEPVVAWIWPSEIWETAVMVTTDWQRAVLPKRAKRMLVVRILDVVVEGVSKDVDVFEYSNSV